jgi:hypothetical protein
MLDGNSHEVNIYHNGELTPQTFHILLPLENEFDSSAFLGMGLSSDTRMGAFDVDFIAYREGVLVPTLAPQGLAGDYNDNGTVDAADYVLWRNNVGTANPLENDPIGGTIGTAHYDQWRANFGKSAGSGSALAQLVAVPEPAGAILLVLGLGVAGVAITARRRGSPCPRFAE